jgi:LPXTG-motif cell wall-anchored protein
VLVAATVVTYGAAVQWAAATGTTSPALLLLAGFTLAGALGAWRRRNRTTALLFLAIAAALGWVASRNLGWEALYVPPLAINVMILWAFARSLAPGRTPLITLFASLVDGELDDATTRYTRRATRWWVVFLALMLAANVALALWAPHEVWSFVAHFINYLLLGAFFVVEFLLRRHFLPARARGGFIAFVRNLARIDVRAVLRKPS